MISIIMRVKNEMPWLKYTLMMLKKQNRQDFELICVDSGSTDGSWEMLLGCGARELYRIKPEEYIPGKVLNEAISKAKGEIIVFNNADCIPQNPDWLGKLIAPLEVDSNVVAVFANQIPRPSAIPLVRKDYERAFGDGKISATWRHFFSLASSAVRRPFVTQFPFNDEIQYSEDIEWSWRMRQLGYQIAYAADAIVEHSHNYNLPQIRKRYRGEGLAEAYIYRDYYKEHPEDLDFGRSVLMAAGMEVIRDWKYLVSKGDLLWMALSPVYRFAQRYFANKGRTT